MTPEQYDAWYEAPRGRWIGGQEWNMLRTALEFHPGESALEVGCGTGWFTRRAAAEGARIIGLDLDENALGFSRQHSPGVPQFLRGDATRLPFGDHSFDKVMSVTALCFVRDWAGALEEIVRVSRHGFARGLLNRKSLLWLQKGRLGNPGAYQGAHWHTATGIARTLRSLPVTDVRYSFGIYLLRSSSLAGGLEGGRLGLDPQYAMLLKGLLNCRTLGNI